jgi:DNA-binding Xre family transcriptional regulator
MNFVNISYMNKVPIRYLPKVLSKKDKKKTARELRKSRTLYKKGIYYNRKKVASFRNKKSSHIKNARRIYHIENMNVNRELARKTGCTMAALKKIVNKGDGAYFSSGSRPNQTPASWGLARLASAITSGKAAAIDFEIIEKGCNHKKTAYKLAKKAVKKHGYGHRRTKKTVL